MGRGIESSGLTDREFTHAFSERSFLSSLEELRGKPFHWSIKHNVILISSAINVVVYIFPWYRVLFVKFKCISILYHSRAMEKTNGKHSLEEDPIMKRAKVDNTTSSGNINDSYLELEFMKTLSSCFCEKQEGLFENGAKIINEPFTCCALPNFIQSDDFMEELKKEIEDLEVELKLSDLYQFKQSKDLSTFRTPYITNLRNLIYGKFLEWMKTITNIPLTDQVDMFCSCYTYTDHLLCHDDELEGRRIAYIYYLSPEWEEKYGGRLDLFNTVSDEPSEVITSFIPKWNNLIFFEVSPVSYHQVSEVLAFKTRTSISGWFYGPPLNPAIHPIEEVLFKPPAPDTVDLKQWINPTYLQPETQVYIRQSFEENWEVECGGYTSYVAKDEKEELLRVDPKPNSLALVYITEETANFIKYINCRTSERSSPSFQDIFSIYREKE
ncbi:prolyl 3-hydroxylase OGFOD1 [Trichonephila inaurata madagascariensis]|uniref:uS12 prolyl 3-hydroxylase n=1 Tax=Trichonephila inaurata madagascariensis TaxID=2747483 RepID=A0A8X7C8S4_9ARAC|nr:prolyl 3-hydroxylase OGFOD1 [Trichonephila inaurata madagascariensis]